MYKIVQFLKRSVNGSREKIIAEQAYVSVAGSWPGDSISISVYESVSGTNARAELRIPLDKIDDLCRRLQDTKARMEAWEAQDRARKA